MKKLMLTVVTFIFVLSCLYVPNALAVSKKELDNRISLLEVRFDNFTMKQKELKGSGSDTLKTEVETVKGEQQLLHDKIQSLEAANAELKLKIDEVKSQVELLAEASSLESQIQSLSEVPIAPTAE